MYLPHKTLVLEKEELPLQKAELILFHQGYPTRHFSLQKESTCIGSSPSSDIFIQDPYISAAHCRIEKRDGLYFLIDQQSKNGTFVNKSWIKETALQHKNYIHIGKTLLQFQLDNRLNPFKNKESFGIISRNPLMHHIFHLIEKVAPVQTTVIIYGETGTGKELIAQAIYKQSLRKKKPFIVINCGAIPKDLIESELFGHVPGAFTGALTKREGSFSLAHEGTLFLDEIGELPLELQPKLLRALEQREIKPVGAELPKKIDVRIIAATHKNLTELIQKGLFRQDLFYRLHLLPIYLPPLRDRREDIPLLIKYFLKDTHLTTKALKLLMQYSWPGNIRELKNTLERAKLFLDTSINNTITEKEVQQILKFTSLKPFSDTVHEMERDMLCEFLDKNQWNRSATARALSMAKSTLLGKMKKYNIVPPEEYKNNSPKNKKPDFTPVM